MAFCLYGPVVRPALSRIYRTAVDERKCTGRHKNEIQSRWLRVLSCFECRRCGAREVDNIIGGCWQAEYVVFVLARRGKQMDAPALGRGASVVRLTWCDYGEIGCCFTTERLKKRHTQQLRGGVTITMPQEPPCSLVSCVAQQSLCCWTSFLLLPQQGQHLRLDALQEQHKPAASLGTRCRQAGIWLLDQAGVEDSAMRGARLLRRLPQDPQPAA